MPFEVFDAKDIESKALGSALLDATIDSLSNTENLEVASRTSSEIIGSQSMSFASAKELISIDYLIEGGIKRRGNEFEISYRLVNADTFITLFSETTVTDGLAYNAAVNAILRSLSEYFSIPVARSIPTSLTSEVNRLLLLGNNMMKRSYDEALWNQATEYLERAYALAPDEAQVVRSLASHYFQLLEFADKDQREALVRQINELMAHAQSQGVSSETLWFLKMQLSADYPNRSTEHSEEILALLKAAHAVGERDYNLYFYLMTTLSSLHRYDEAINYGLEGIEQHPLVYRLYAGLSFVYSLKQDGINAEHWAIKMADIAPADESTEWVTSIAAMVRGEHQRALSRRKKMRDNDKLGLTLESDILSLAATAQSQQLEKLWPLCSIKSLPLATCWNIALAEAVQSSNVSQIADLMTNDLSIALENEASVGLFIQSLPFLTRDVFTESMLSSIEPAFQQYLDGRSEKRLPELVLPAAAYLTEMDILSVPLSKRESWETSIFQDKSASDFFLAEQAAIARNTKAMFDLLERIVEKSETPPVGRYYLFFDSPFFRPYHGHVKFEELKREYSRKMNVKYQHLTWQF